MTTEREVVSDPRGPCASFSRKNRILTSKEFAAFKNGCFRGSGEFLNLVVRKQDGLENEARLGLIAGRKNGNAVKRNRFKRLVREVFRTQMKDVARGCDILAVSKAKIPDGICLRDIEWDLEKAWRRYVRFVEGDSRGLAK